MLLTVDPKVVKLTGWDGLKQLKEKNLLQVATDFFQVEEITTRRDHKGIFPDKSLNENTYFECLATSIDFKQISPEIEKIYK